MKNFFRTFIATLLLVITGCMVKAQTTDTLHFSVNDIEMEATGEYTRFSIPLCETTWEVGNPELPCVELTYIIPYGQRIVSIIMIDSTMQTLQGNYLVYPKQPESPIGDTVAYGFVQPNLSVYGSTNSYPMQAFTIKEQYNTDGFQLATVLFYPLRYFPANGRIDLFTSVRFQLNYENDLNVNMRPLTQPRNMYNLTKKLILSQIRNGTEFNQMGGGPISITESNSYATHGVSLVDMTIDADPEYIIITNNSDVNGQSLFDATLGKDMTNVFQELADWKTKKGVPTKVVSVDDICSNYTGNDVQAKIHNFLADVYQHYGMLFVLFGGDVNVVPARLIDTVAYVQGWSTTHVSPFHTDLYYTAVESSWDSNGNGIYGESIYSPLFNDIMDTSPEYYYGRAPVENVLEAMTFVNKEMVYEKLLPVEDRNYVSNIGAMVGYLTEQEMEANKLNSTMNGMEDILGRTIPIGKNGISQTNIIKWRSYDSNKLDPSVMNYWMEFNKNNAIACFNTYIPLSILQQQRSHFTIHIDHSSYSSMGTSAIKNKLVINRHDVDELRNSPYYQLIYSMGCYAGDFNKDCIVEHFINNSQGGAIAMIASSAICYPSETNRLQYLLTYLYEHKIQNHTYDPIEYRLGPLSNRYRGSNLYMSKNHLFGDPELPIWTREPVDLTVSTSPSTITNQNGQLTVSVSGMAYSEYATNDVYVCVMKDGEVYLREHYDGTAHSHNFVFEEVNPETAGELKVTVTGHNYIPYETTVPVTITGKNVYIVEQNVMDESGNCDGKLDAGETVNFKIALQNNGTVNLTNVTAILSCEFLDENLNQNINNYLTVVTSTANYGSIAQNTTVTRNDFQLALSNAIPNRTSLRCTLTISDGSGVVNVRSFVLSIGASEIEYVSVRHEQKQNGKIGLDIDLVNLGFGTAKGIEATLTPVSSGVQITQGTATYGAMTHLEAKTRPFEFILNSGGIDGKSFTLNVTDAYNKSWSFDFVLYDILDTIENLTFENTEHSIKLRWNPIEDSKGYYVYRSMTANANYERLNSYPVPSAVYPDLGLEVKQTYYYGVSYLDEYGNESEKARITAWTSLPIAEGWPIAIPDGLGRAWGTAPNLADINGDGKQEIFLTTGVGDQRDSIGAILSFNNQGEELYDIDHNPTTISGFANLHISMTGTPAIGDIDNDGIIEVVVATRCDKNDSNYKLCVYKNADADNDGAPDLAWEPIPLDYKNFNGVVLADLDDNGTLEIIVPNQGRNKGNGNTYTYLEVFDCFGNYYYPKEKIKVIDPCNNDEKAVTMPVVADFDNDGYKEIVFGLEGGVYLWGYSNQTPTPLVESNPGTSNPNDKERMDCPVIAADIDGDGNLEILYMVIRNGIGYVRAINSNNSLVSGWNGDTHFIPLSNTSIDWAWPPYFCVADIDNDGSIEIFVADGGVLKMWNSDGTTFGTGEIQIPNLDCQYFQPIIADVDGNGDCEIVIPSQNGYIYAYKPNGDAVPGWPLAVVDLATIPAITDIDGDGYNEVIAASQTELYVWHTEGESKYNQWDRFRYNKYNNAVYEIPCSYNVVPLEITGTQVWNDDRHVNRDVVVNNGAHLTIKSELRFSEDSRIIVKPGGRLILDGCRLTNACSDELWQGIEVWGNRSTHQYEINGSFGQGYVEMRNGATIENAVCALALWRPNHWSYTGGIVHATDAVFRNNQRSVHALYYKNQSYINGKETDYNAWFNRCQFIVDENYLGDEDHVFHKHVDLDHVRGFKFRTCDFSVTAPSSNISYWTSGIAGNEAGFSVSGMCSNNNIYPCPSYDNSTFSGFLSAISAVNDGTRTPPTITVTRSSFNNNDFGIYVSNLSNTSVRFCDFNVKRHDNWLCGAGIFLENVLNYSVEENALAKTNTFNGEGYGVVIKNCAVQSKVYRNQFENLYCGNLAWGRNILMKSSNNYIGLEYGCNTNTGNAIDFYVLGENGVFSGIQSSQGSSLAAARNTFSANGYHFYNDGDHRITYYYYNVAGFEDERPLSYNEDKVQIDSTNLTDGCPSNFGNGVDPKSLVLTPAEKYQREQEYYEAYTAYNGLKAVYDSRMDGGNTNNMLYNIAMATPSDMWALRAQLLGASPYLSGEVLTDVSDRDDVFTESVLFEILLSNPEELKKDSLMDHLRNKTNPLPEYMMNILDQVANGATARSVMETRMAAYRGEYTRAAGDIIRSIVNDTVLDISELRGWLANMKDIYADRDIIATYVDEGDFTNALILANMLPSLYGLTSNDLVEHNDYVELLELYRDLYNDDRNIMQLDSAERVQVERIAVQSSGYPQAMAQAVLYGTNWESYAENPFDCPTLTLPQGGQRGGYVFTQEDLGRALGLNVSVKPNPATTWAAVDYTLPAKLSKATITVSNALGVTVMSTELNGNQGQKVLDLRGLADGVYLYTIRCGEYVQSGKLVIAK